MSHFHSSRQTITIYHFLQMAIACNCIAAPWMPFARPSFQLQELGKVQGFKLLKWSEFMIFIDLVKWNIDFRHFESSIYFNFDPRKLREGWNGKRWTRWMRGTVQFAKWRQACDQPFDFGVVLKSFENSLFSDSPLSHYITLIYAAHPLRQATTCQPWPFLGGLCCPFCLDPSRKSSPTFLGGMVKCLGGVPSRVLDVLVILVTGL
jgi:hypothetical protein